MNTIFIGTISQTLSGYLNTKQYTNIAILVDENTKSYCLPLLHGISKLADAHIISIQSGEEQKNLSTCTHIWNELTKLEFDRNALFINLGGGVIGDMGGFCAATYKRGIDFIQIPTTLLSMADASVGGKLGIDFGIFKNHIGVFEVPDAVFVDTNFLNTLSQRELRSGFAEIIKHCLIADSHKWHELLIKSDWNKHDWAELVQHSVTIKDSITQADPQENGLRKTLNFGHTLGHAIESFYLSTSQKLFHGEAIAIGMVCESYLSYKKTGLPHTDLQQIKKYITHVFGQALPDTADFKKIITLTRQDKKNKGTDVQFALLNEVGKCTYNISCSVDDMEEALKYIHSA